MKQFLRLVTIKFISCSPSVPLFNGVNVTINFISLMYGDSNSRLLGPEFGTLARIQLKAKAGWVYN